MHKVSIAIPLIENAQVGLLLNSLLLQNENGFELSRILIVSDIPNDKTLDLVKLFKDSRIEIIEGRKRLGKIIRLNQALDLLSFSNDHVLLLEPDNIPTDNDYIAKLIAHIPESEQFSYIYSDTTETKSANFVGHIFNVGYNIRHELFISSKVSNNLYLSTGGRLLSNEFAKNFRWKKDNHKDFFCYRKALESSLPLIFADEAKTYCKSAENLSDYLKQSYNFQKALTKERSQSQIYKLHISKLKLIKVLSKYLLKHPFATLSYLLILLYSRLAFKFAQEYDQFLNIYHQ